MQPWMKFAIQGATYARALQNAATRGGRPLAPAMSSKLTQMQAQPQAKLQPGLGQMFREHATGGAQTPTPQQAGMQNMLAHVPWAGEEHGGSPFAESTLNAQLKQRGLDHTTPAGQPNIHKQIAERFGPPRAPQRPTQIGHASGDQTQAKAPVRGAGVMSPHFGGSFLDLFDGPQGHSQHLPDLTRAGVGPQRMMPTRQPMPNYKPTMSAGQASPIGIGGAAQRGDATRVLKAASALSTAAGIGIPLAVGGGLLANKPGIKSNLKNLVAGKGSTQEQDTSGELPEEAVNQAGAIHAALTAHGLDPMALRMGIDAPPGSGKTTLARALSQRTGMKHYGLDWEPGNAWKSTVGLGRNVESMPHTPQRGEILEHYMLGRTYDPETMDAMVHIHRDPETIKQQLRQRGNAAYISDMMDLDKSLNVADLGFKTLHGDAIDIGNGIQMKLRPQEGWGNELDERLRSGGIDPTGLSRHEKLLTLQSGHRTEGAGWTPYIKNPLSTGETAALGASIPLGMMAARALRNRPR